jgi:hypothetical protein
VPWALARTSSSPWCCTTVRHRCAVALHRLVRCHEYRRGVNGCGYGYCFEEGATVICTNELSRHGLEEAHCVSRRGHVRLTAFSSSRPVTCRAANQHGSASRVLVSALLLTAVSSNYPDYTAPHGEHCWHDERERQDIALCRQVAQLPPGLWLASSRVLGKSRRKGSSHLAVGCACMRETRQDGQRVQGATAIGWPSNLRLLTSAAAK